MKQKIKNFWKMNKETQPTAESSENTTSGTAEANINTENMAETDASNNSESDSVTDKSASEVEKLKAELAEQKDKYIRLYSEFDNYRKRTSKEKLDTIKSATEDLVKDLLPVLDDMERARQNMETATDVAAVKEGVELVFHKLYKVLGNRGLKPMDAKGQPFDADVHEAITSFPGDESQKGLIIDELEKGYFLHEKAIRYAKVVIGA